jgi:nitrogen PTS system EIIA component
MHVARPMVTLCFLERPVEFGALDGRPVHTLFTMLSPTVRAHLHILACLSFALQQPVFSEAVINQGSREEIYAACEKVDRNIPAAATSE